MLIIRLLHSSPRWGMTSQPLLMTIPAPQKTPDVLAIANEENRVIIANDKDFGELVFRRHLPHKGIILFRLGNEALDLKKQWLQRILTDYADQLNQFIVISDRGIRIRDTGRH
jgi:predicted nuclease of predicted toxin-antitoxin system